MQTGEVVQNLDRVQRLRRWWFSFYTAGYSQVTAKRMVARFCSDCAIT